MFVVLFMEYKSYFLTFVFMIGDYFVFCLYYLCVFLYCFLSLFCFFLCCVFSFLFGFVGIVIFF